MVSSTGIVRKSPPFHVLSSSVERILISEKLFERACWCGVSKVDGVPVIAARAILLYPLLEKIIDITDLISNTTARVVSMNRRYSLKIKINTNNFIVQGGARQDHVSARAEEGQVR